MTIFLLHGGGASLQLEDGTIRELFAPHHLKHILLFANHSSQGGQSRLAQLQAGLSTPVTLFRPGLNLSQFDSVYVAGGDEQRLLQEFQLLGLGRLTSLINKSSLYFGTSAGTILLAKHYYAWGSKYDNPFSRGLYHNGLGIFPDTLFEVHYSQVGFQSRLHRSVKFETWAKHFIGIDVGSVVTIEGHDVAHAQVTLGTAEIIHRT